MLENVQTITDVLVSRRMRLYVFELLALLELDSDS